MKILGVNISHDSSICIYENKKITNFWLEERFNQVKNWEPGEEDGTFFLSILKKIDFKPDLVCYSSYTKLKNKRKSNEDLIKLIQKQLDNPEYYFDEKQHHVYHALCGFYFSKFNEALSIVIDGGGAQPSYDGYQELDSIFYLNKKNIFYLFQHFSNRRFVYDNGYIENYSEIERRFLKESTEVLFTSKSNAGYNFSRLSTLAGFNNEHGKLMGLSSYAYCKNKYDLNYEKINLAKEAQEKSFEKACDLIEKALRFKNINNFVLSGGYFLNCSNNFKYVKKYPNLNFFVDPIPHDAGTAVGTCLYNDYK
jgi:carbamoyltransferase